MPGILPMKVIKVGNNAQARIAQACDRCRSKKIRCDGVRPCCSQCSNVGFECKTSDKLSRRAFPRGYTESLEERVRSLESENRDLKDLLDEKDEKIDMLTKIHPQSHPLSNQSNHATHLPSPRRTSATPSSASPSDTVSEPAPSKEETFKVQQSPYLLENGGSNSYFAGTSSGKTFIDAFKHKVQERGRSTSFINAELLLSSTAKHPSSAMQTPQGRTEWKTPPRLLSDQMVNIFFQEWAPLFPVLHRPTFLTLYEEYTSSPESVTDNTSLAQLNVVFALALLSHSSQNAPELASLEIQWQTALEPVQTEQSLSTLQCLVLAQLYCIQRGDYNKLLTYKALAVSLSSRLGLQQSQKRFALGTLTCETRKKVFWTLYAIDSFSAVLLGLPRQIKDEDVQCEYPVDADDEYVTERGFQPLLPGESTRLSSALAFFRVTRILSRVLEEVYPALTSYELSLQRLSSLSDDLDDWQKSLAPHLRLQFAQDKPSVGTVNSRSPLLSLTYHYIRALIHRPAVSSSLGDRSSSSMIALAGSCKHIVQIIQLLAERGLSFSTCLNKDELLILSGFGLLYQGLDLDSESKLMQDNQRSVAAIIGILDRSKAPAASEFRRVACAFLPLPPVQKRHAVATPSRHNSDGAMPAPYSSTISPALKQHFKAMTSMFNLPGSKPLSRHDKDHRRATEPEIAPWRHPLFTQSHPDIRSNSDTRHMSRSEPARSPHSVFTPCSHASASHVTKRSIPQSNLNLDYLSFVSESSSEPNPQPAPRPAAVKPEPTDWERLLGSIDNGQTNIFDATYGGPPVEYFKSATRPLLPLNVSHHNSVSTGSGIPADDNHSTWNSDFWTSTTSDLTLPSASSVPGVTESVLSFSTDDVASAHESGDDNNNNNNNNNNNGIAIHDWAGLDCGRSKDEYRAIVMPDLEHEDNGLLELGWDAFGMESLQ